MPLTDSQVRSLTATDKMQKKGVGDCLYVIVEPARKGGVSPSTGSFDFLLAVEGNSSGSALVPTAEESASGP